MKKASKVLGIIDGVTDIIMALFLLLWGIGFIMLSNQAYITFTNKTPLHWQWPNPT